MKSKANRDKSLSFEEKEKVKTSNEFSNATKSDHLMTESLEEKQWEWSSNSPNRSKKNASKINGQPKETTRPDKEVTQKKNIKK